MKSVVRASWIPFFFAHSDLRASVDEYSTQQYLLPRKIRRAETTRYLLGCNLEGSLNVLKWSYDFGVETSEGRTIKQGVIGIFGGTAFNPEEKIAVGNESISFAQYAAMNIQLFKAADLNGMLHTRGVEKRVTVLKIRTRARNETEVRELPAGIWDTPAISLELLNHLASKNAAPSSSRRHFNRERQPFHKWR